jgi:Mn-dependent DtxR family transcriptional regulator
MAIRRLKRDGLISTGAEGQLALTVAGKEIASRLLNRHHLIERMLTEIFGLEWYKVHDEAEHLEHAVRTSRRNWWNGWGGRRVPARQRHPLTAPATGAAAA